MADRETEIEDYAFLSATQTGAVVSPQTNISRNHTGLMPQWASLLANAFEVGFIDRLDASSYCVPS